MIVDTFLFFNELDVLELRLKELADKVERFVLVESPMTFSGQPKPLYFAENRERFRDYPIWNVITNDVPHGTHSGKTDMTREYHQRDAILRGLEGLPEDTLVLLSDADEIPANIPQVCPPDQVFYFAQMFFYYSMNHRFRGRWYGTRMCQLGAFRKLRPHNIRQIGTHKIDPGGWHFSHLYGEDIERYVTKLRAGSHQEYGTAHWINPERIRKAVEAGRDLFDRPGHELVIERGLGHLPEAVQQAPSRWKQYLYAV